MGARVEVPADLSHTLLEIRPMRNLGSDTGDPIPMGILLGQLLDGKSKPNLRK
jgi:hypothetical protein